MVLSRLASKVSLELVELFYDDGRYDLSLTGTAFEFAAGSGQVESEALAATASKGYVELVEFLSVKEKLSPEQVRKAFTEAAVNVGPSFSIARDQAGVLKYLFATGFISPSFMKSLFENAARRSSLDVVKFLYAKGAIPPGMANKAFGLAVQHNGGAVMSFLAKTGAVPATIFEGDLGCAVVDGDIYSIACLYNNGQHLRRSCPEIAVASNSISSEDEENEVGVYDLHQLKCLDTELLPHIIRPLPHVMKLVDLFCMSVDMAMLEAAATGQVEWLNRLIS
ncbi:hypothetical protein JG687_00007570 [Phytophthora cactorum]|uniref:Ankyrin repeat-containing domain n=1 Tax=Phytophthora cactorum TaxID=29920 RepID=A0A8T1UES9_9STRA|nr:hypothetical protein JG687_00007570 [Phytophthora cactorum]